MKTTFLKFLLVALCATFILFTFCSCSENTIPTRSDEIKMTTAIDELNKAEGIDNNIIVSFPGIGVEPTVINKTAFTIGDFRIYWYAIIMIIGVLLGFACFFLLAKSDGFMTNDILDVTIWSIVASLIGARLYYILSFTEKYKGANFWNIFTFNNGGLAIYGAIFGGIISVLVVSKMKKIRPLRVLDNMVCGVLIAQIIGRFGDFVNGQSYGYEIKDGDTFSWIRMGIYPHNVSSNTIETSSYIAYVHPTFLYEAVWNAVGLIVLSILHKRKKFDGQTFYIYMAWYGLGRTIIEILRTDSLDIMGNMKISVFVGCLCFFGCVGLLIYRAIQGKKERLSKESYESEYPLFRTEASVSVDEKSDNNTSVKLDETLEKRDNNDFN